MSFDQDQKVASDFIAELKKQSELGLKEYFEKEFLTIKDECLKAACKGAKSILFTWTFSPVLESKDQRDNLGRLLEKEGFTLLSISGQNVYPSQNGGYKDKFKLVNTKLIFSFFFLKRKMSTENKGEIFLEEKNFSCFGDYLRDCRNKKIEEIKKKDNFLDFMEREWEKIKLRCEEAAKNGCSELEVRIKVKDSDEKFILKNRDDEVKKFFMNKGFEYIFVFPFSFGTSIKLKW